MLDCVLFVCFVQCILLQRIKKGRDKKSEITLIYDDCYLTFNKISSNLKQAIRDGFYAKSNEKR